MKNWKVTAIIAIAIPILCFAKVAKIVVTDVVKQTRINLGGADDVIISNVKVTGSGMNLNISFNWAKKTTNNPGEIDQIFVAIERKIIKTVYMGIPGKKGVSGAENFSYTVDAPTSGRNMNLFVVMTPSYSESKGKAHYELEKGGHRARIASFEPAE